MDVADGAKDDGDDGEDEDDFAQHVVGLVPLFVPDLLVCMCVCVCVCAYKRVSEREICRFHFETNQT